MPCFRVWVFLALTPVFWASNINQYSGGGVPVGSVVLQTSGTSCPVGFLEAGALDGLTLIGTTIAHADVGTTGGSDTITPAGTATFAGNALAAHTHTFAGVSLTGHTHTFTGLALIAHTHTFIGSALGTHTHTFAGTANSNTSLVSGGTPAGSNNVPVLTMSSYTPAGSVAAPAFIGSSGTVPAQAISWPVAVPIFTGNALGTHLHGVGTYTVAWPPGVPTFTGNALAVHAHELPIQLTSNVLTRFLAAATFGTGTSRAALGQATDVANATSAAVALSQAVTAGTPGGTNAWPAGPSGVPTISGSDAAITAGTPAGTNSSDSAGTPSGSISFSGSPADNRSAFMLVIFCRKT